jgi:hypothetical protein
MIPKSGYRLSEKIMLNKVAESIRKRAGSGQDANALIHSTAQDDRGKNRHQ